MKVIKGGTRIVFIFFSLGLVFKLPRIRLILVLGEFVRDVSNGKWGLLKRELAKSWRPSFLKRPLVEGILANWSEYSFYRRTKHPLLWPTYFSLLGFINVQPLAPPWFDITGFHQRCYPFLGDDLWLDPHHFECDNFCIFDGHLRAVDYGSIEVQDVIERKGMLLYEGFVLEMERYNRKK